MIKPIVFVCVLLLAGGLQAAPEEDGTAQCTDGIDNDFDGMTDCDEEACKSSLSQDTCVGENCNCGLPSGPMVMGIGADRLLLKFDVPMVTREGEPASDLLAVDLDGRGPNRDDVLVGRRGSIAAFRNRPKADFSSLPSKADVVTNRILTGDLRIASGDVSGDGRADIVALNGNLMQRFFGDGNGGFTASPIAAVAPGNDLPAVNGSAVVVAGDRLRIYDPAFTTEPANFEDEAAFGSGGLCASVAWGLAGALNPSAVASFTTTTGERMVATAFGGRNEVVVFRLRPQETTMQVEPVGTVIAGGIVNDLAYGADGDLLVFARNDGHVEARAIQTAEPRLVEVAGLEPLALDIDPERGPFTHIAVGPLFDGKQGLVVTEAKTETIFVLPFSADAGWTTADLVVEQIDRDSAVERRAADVALGHFNDDDLLDVAVLDGESDNVVVLRQQPPPCATFITATTHGLMPLSEIYPAEARPFNGASRFGRYINERTRRINAERRPADGFRDVTDADPELCPVRHIDVRGHWEKDSGKGTTLAYVGRGGWLGGMLLPAPICHTPVASLPAFTPVDFWLSAIFLLIPTTEPWVPGCALPVSDTATLGRFLLAGIGAGTEHFGREAAGDGSRAAAVKLRDVLNEAIVDADAQMDACQGHVYVDMVGHSRGGAVNQQVLRHGFVDRSRYNFDISTTIIDSPDSSPSDHFRPWIRGGYIVGDPLIDRVGSEWNSSFFGNDSRGTPIDFLTILINRFDAPAEFIRSTVIGLPLGRDRQAELEDPLRTFGAYAGPFPGINHEQLAGDSNGELGFLWVDPQIPQNSDDPDFHNVDAPSDVAADTSPKFAFRETSLMGPLLAEPRIDLPFDAVGFHNSAEFTAAGENRCIPDACGRAEGTCGFPPRGNDDVLRRNIDGVEGREMVKDRDFRGSTGVVRNATDIVALDPDLKSFLPEPQFAGMRDFIKTTAATQFVGSGSAWTRTGRVTFPKTGKSIIDGVAHFVAWPGVDYSSLDTLAEQEAEVRRWKGELGRLEDTDTDARDRVAGLVAATTRTLDGTVAFAQFPAGRVHTLRQELAIASRTYAKFLVRVDYKLASSRTGSLRVRLRGDGLSFHKTLTATNGMGRRTAQWTTAARVPVGDNNDVLTLAGRDLKVYSISVTPYFPVTSTLTGSSYELVVLDAGVTWDVARILAKSSQFNGQSGRLARVTSIALLDELSAKLAPDLTAWVDGHSADGSAGSFMNSDGESLAANLFHVGTRFTVPRKRGAGAYTHSAPLGMRLGHASPSVTHNGVRRAFLVEYSAGNIR